MKDNPRWSTRKYRAIRGFIDGTWIFIAIYPILSWYLWKFWWLRPIIIWYLPFSALLLFNYTHFLTTAIFCWFTKGGKNSALRPLFMRFQLFITKTFFGTLHGLEIHGLHNLPKGGGLIAYYHAPFIPVDVAYLFSCVYLKYGRMIGGSMDVNWHQNSFFRPLVELYDYSSDRQKFIEDLKKGELRSVAPGGAYEAMFSHDYSLEWRSRIGFAKIAKETGAPVVPMYTTNLQHSMPLLNFCRSDTMQEWYSKLRRPLCVPKCYVPVKMHTYLGEPLVCGKDEDPETFAKRVKAAIEGLRDKYQKRDQTYWNALRERLW